MSAKISHIATALFLIMAPFIGQEGKQIKKPELVKSVDAAYPELAFQARIEGVVVLEFTVGIDGRVSNIKVIRSIPLLDSAAIEAVKQWQYKPGLVNGKPAKFISTATVLFRLTSAQAMAGTEQKSAENVADKESRPAESIQPAPEPSTSPSVRPEIDADGFRPAALPPVAEEQTRRISPQGGDVVLKSGAKLRIPPGALAKETVMTLRQLVVSEPDRGLFHITAPGAKLAVPAVLEFPVRSPDGSEVLGVDVLHFHKPEGPGQRIPVKWKRGDLTARVELKEMSVIGYAIVYGVFVALVGSEIDIQSNNTAEKFAEAGRAAIFRARHAEVKLSLPLYEQHYNESLWCWACSMAAVLQAGQPVEEYLGNPIKPQTLAALGKYARTGILGAGPSSLHWWDNKVFQWTAENASGLNILTYLNQASGSPVEGRCFTSYPVLVQYIIQNLDQGYPVIMDIRAMGHTVNVFGYNMKGLWISDPSQYLITMSSRPMLFEWNFLFQTLNGGLASFVNNYVITTIIKKNLEDEQKTLSLNVPSSDFKTETSQVPAPDNLNNKNGLYFTTPKAEANAGLIWDGSRPSGLGLAFNEPDGNLKAFNIMVVGLGTKVGLRKIEIINTADTDATVSLRAYLISPAGKRIATLAEADGLDVPALKTVKYTAPKELPLLSLIPASSKSAEKYVFRFSLLANGQEVDRVNIPVELKPFRLDSVTPEQENEKVKYRIKGAGLKLPNVTLMGGSSYGQDRPYGGLRVLNDTEAEFVPSSPEFDPFTLHKGGQIYLKIFGDSRNPNPITDDLETNRLAVETGGWILTDFWSFSRASLNPDISGKVVFLTSASAVSSSRFGETQHAWTTPPRQFNPGDPIRIKLEMKKLQGQVGRSYTCVFYGTNSTKPQGLGWGVVMIPSIMDWAGEQPDEGPLFKGQPLAFAVIKKGTETVVDASLKGGLFMTRKDPDSAELIWTGKAPEPTKDGKFLLIISSGHAIRGTQYEDKDFTFSGTLSVGGAAYYEYTWQGK